MTATAPEPQTLEELFKPTPHPCAPWPFSPDQIRRLATQEETRTELVKFYRERERRIALANPITGDPHHYRFGSKQWDDANALLARKSDILVSGANRSSKTEWAADVVAKLLVNKPRSIVWCLCQSNETSIRGDGQQERVWRYLPLAWRNLNHKRKGTSANIGYNDKNRFSENAFIGPNGSECRFMNYEQDIKVIEGGAIDLWWADELVPVEWVTTLRGRTIDRAGKGIVTFTPIYGFNETIADYIEGGTVVEWVDCELRPDQQLWPHGEPGKVPYRMESLKQSRGAIFFQAKNNAFIDWPRLKDQWKDSSTETMLARLYGVTRRRVGRRFPKFGKAHIIPRAKLPPLAEMTCYHYLDFAWDRNWAMIWIAVQRVNGKRRVFVYRDWPDKRTHGEWVLRSSAKKDGERGPAQSALGYGIESYKQLILTLEGNAIEGKRKIETAEPEFIYERRGDPASGALKAMVEEDGGTSILELMAEPSAHAPAMDVMPVNTGPRAGSILHGIGLLNDWLDYNEQEPVTVNNEPELFICEECEQVIDCLNIWTGGDGQKGASKDFVDLIRYAALEDVDYCTPGMLGSRGGGGY